MRWAYREIFRSERIGGRHLVCYWLHGIVTSRPDPASSVRGVQVVDCQAEKVDRPLDPEDTCRAEDAPEPDQLGGFLGKVEVADH